VRPPGREGGEGGQIRQGHARRGGKKRICHFVGGNSRAKGGKTTGEEKCKKKTPIWGVERGGEAGLRASEKVSLGKKKKKRSTSTSRTRSEVRKRGEKGLQQSGRKAPVARRKWEGRVTFEFYPRGKERGEVSEWMDKKRSLTTVCERTTKRRPGSSLERKRGKSAVRKRRSQLSTVKKRKGKVLFLVKQRDRSVPRRGEG